MNAVRNFIYTRSANLLRTYGQNALLNNFSDAQANSNNTAPVPPSIQTQTTNASINANGISVPKSLLDATIFRSKQLSSNVALSPNTLRKYRNISRTLELQYICKLCGTRNRKLISQQAYTSGIVILQCEGCAVNHLICDHIGWFANIKDMDKSFDDILAEKRNGGALVNVIRVDEQGELI